MPRGRRPNITPTISVHTHLSQDAYAKMALHLWSEVEGRVPAGKIGKFLDTLILEHFKETASGTKS